MKKPIFLAITIIAGILIANPAFSQKANKSMKEKNPEATFGELSKAISALWKEMQDESKQPFIDLAEQDKIRANKDKEDWNEKVAMGFQ